MFKYINSVIAPFDCLQKFNVKSSYHQPKFAKLALALSDVKQKEDLDRAIVVFFTALLLGGSFPVFRYLTKSVSQFKTRKGDLASVITCLRGERAFFFLEALLRHELYLYHMTLKHYKLNISETNSLSLSSPDIKYLFLFRRSILHILPYTYGFDVTINISAPRVFDSKQNRQVGNEELKIIYLSAFNVFL